MICQNCVLTIKQAVARVVTAEGFVLNVCDECRDYLTKFAHAAVVSGGVAEAEESRY